MKFYYIDQSFFLESNKAIEMLLRFVKRLNESEVDIVLISTTDISKYHYYYQDFISVLQGLDIHVIEENKPFFLGSIQGELSEDHCVMNQQTFIPLPNSYLEIVVEEDSIQSMRYYLDVFYSNKKMPTTQIMSVKDLENFLKQSFSIFKNPKKLS